jgi:hypothetical protein
MYAEDYIKDLADVPATDYEALHRREWVHAQKLGLLYAGVLFADGSMIVHPPCTGEEALNRETELNRLMKSSPVDKHRGVQVVYDTHTTHFNSFFRHTVLDSGSETREAGVRPRVEIQQ